MIVVKTINAVECAVCSKLHKVGQNGAYIVIWGRLIVNLHSKDPINLGNEDNPTVICSAPSCALRLFRFGYLPDNVISDIVESITPEED